MSAEPHTNLAGPALSAVVRQVNDRIRDFANLPGRSREAWQFCCECGDPHCHDYVTLTPGQYDSRRTTAVFDPILSSRHG